MEQSYRTKEKEWEFTSECWGGVLQNVRYKSREWGYHGLPKYYVDNTNGKSTLYPFLMFLCFAHYFISKKVLTDSAFYPGPET